MENCCRSGWHVTEFHTEKGDKIPNCFSREFQEPSQSSEFLDRFDFGTAACAAHAEETEQLVKDGRERREFRGKTVTRIFTEKKY